jgi:hypothetical protein
MICHWPMLSDGFRKDVRCMPSFGQWTGASHIQARRPLPQTSSPTALISASALLCCTTPGRIR